MASFKEVIGKLGERNKEKKEKFKQLEEDFRLQKKLEEMQMSSNERELNMFQEREREEAIKEALNNYRNKEKETIKGRNPLNTENIMKSKWEVMKEKNMFKDSKNILSNNKFIHKNNKNLLKSSMRLIR